MAALTDKDSRRLFGLLNEELGQPCRPRKLATFERVRRIGVEDQQLSVAIAMPAVLVAGEIEQAVERARDLIERTALCDRFWRLLVDPPEIEIVLDEAQDGGLIRHRVVDVILARMGATGNLSSALARQTLRP